MLTVKQQRCLDWIAEFIEQKGLSPSFEDIRLGLNYRSKDPVRSLLNALGNKGYITRERYKARSIKLIKPPSAEIAQNKRSPKAGTAKDGSRAALSLVPPPQTVPLERQPGARLRSSSRAGDQVLRGIPLLGGIAAHSPVTTFTDEPEVYLPLVLFPNLTRRSAFELSQLFALRVLGDSMIESHILDGDVILLRRNPEVMGLKDGAIVAARVNDEATLKHYIRNGETVTLQPANSAYRPTTFNAEEVDVQGVYTGILMRGVI